MNTFFDYVFYSIYYWNKKLDVSFNKIFPVGSDALFSAVWGLAFLHAINLGTIYYVSICLLDMRQTMFRMDYFLGGLFVVCLLFDYYYYIKLNKHKTIMLKYRKAKINIIGAIFYLVLSVAMVIVSLSWAYDKL